VKTCFKCQESKPISEFYKHPEMGDGFLGKCKTCARADVAANRLARLDYYRAYDRERAKAPKKKAQISLIVARWRKADPRRQKAHNAAARLHRDPPAECERCKEPKRLEKHHPDYDQPELIEWVCKPCHTIADRERREREHSIQAA
jgi:hypothetical protein